MNFNVKQNNRDIKKLLLRPEKRKSGNPKKPDQLQFYKGIYVISRDEETDKNDQLRYKIGMSHGAGGIYKRMDGYKMGWAYPDEFFIHFFIITPKAENAKKLEKIILAYKNMEAVPNPRNTTQNLEYRIVIMKKTLQDSLLKALKSNPKLWDYCITFGVNGWKKLQNTGADLIGSGVLSKPSDDYRKKPMLYSDVSDFVEKERLDMHRNTGGIYDKKRKAPLDLQTIKKGDAIRDNWGEAIVTRVSKKGEKNNPNPYIKVKSDKYPEDYKLYLH